MSRDRSTPVAVVLGGPSAEHDVSLASGRAIAAALVRAGHRVEGWLIGLDRRWWRLPEAALDAGIAAVAYDDPPTLGAAGPYSAPQALDRIAANEPQPIVFIALHGPFGEDGTLQALCEAAGLVYTGSGVAASAIGMDKALFKRLVRGLGLPVVPWREVTVGELTVDRSALLEALAAFARSLLDPRVIVKPARLGSSVGMTIVHRPDEIATLGAALDAALRFDDHVLVEAYLAHARELEAAVVGNGPQDLAIYGPGEVYPSREFYDYVAKYSPGGSRTSTAPDLTQAVLAQAHAIAREAFLAVGAEGFARVDFLLQGDALYLSEVNTIPGFTSTSFFPALCAAGGFDFPAICEQIVLLAQEREARRPRHELRREDLP